MDTIINMEAQLHNLQLADKLRKEAQNRRSKKAYDRKYKISDDMKFAEKVEVLRNIAKRQQSYKQRYNGKSREEQQQRSREYYHKKKKIIELNTDSDSN